MKRLTRRAALALVLALLLSTLALAEPAGPTTQTETAELAWNEDGSSLRVTAQAVSGECFLLVLPAKLANDGSAQDYTLSLADAIYVAQAAASEGAITFERVRPETWTDCVLVLTGAELEGPRVLGTVCTSRQTLGTGFADVSLQDWFCPAVTYAADQGLIAGFDDGTFRPGEAITAGQYLTILYRYLHGGLDLLPEAETTGSDWQTGAQVLAQALELEPELDRAMTRFETAGLTAAVLEYAAAEAGLALQEREAVGFLDVPETDPNYPAASFLQRVYGVDGYPELEGYTFRGENGITRAEAAQVLYNVFTKSIG